MDPATTQLLIRTAGELGVMTVNLLRSSGQAQAAEEIEAILRRSDLAAARVIDRAQHELEKLVTTTQPQPWAVVVPADDPIADDDNDD
jgi:hypothetical protein